MEVAAVAMTPSLFSTKHKQNTYSRRPRLPRRLIPLSPPSSSRDCDRQLEFQDDSVVGDHTSSVGVVICRSENVAADTAASVTMSNAATFTTRSIDIDYLSSAVAQRSFDTEQHEHLLNNKDTKEDKENTRPEKLQQEEMVINKEAEYKVTLALTPVDSDSSRQTRPKSKVVLPENNSSGISGAVVERVRKSSLVSHNNASPDDGSKEKKSVRFADSVQDVTRESSSGRRPLSLRYSMSSSAALQHQHHQYGYHQHIQHQQWTIPILGSRRSVGIARSNSSSSSFSEGALMSLPLSSLSTLTISQMPAVTDRFVVHASLVLPRLLRDNTTVTSNVDESSSAPSSLLDNGQQRYVSRKLPADVMLHFARVRLRQSDDCLYASS